MNCKTSPKSSDLIANTIDGCVSVEPKDDHNQRLQRLKRRKSRWDNPFEKCSKVETSLQPSTYSDIDPQTQIQMLKFQIQEATSKLAKLDLGISLNSGHERSPSPEPVYDEKGVRLNLRHTRLRAVLIEKRNEAISKLREIDPSYEPPSAFKYKNVFLEEKVYIPTDEYPNINFMGLLLGPRGKYLEEIKNETKCNIVIRGKGSLKSGMTGITKDGRKIEALNEPMHAFITASTSEDVKTGAAKIQELINLQVYHPDSEKAVSLRSRHMHDLAILNGTIRESGSKFENVEDHSNSKSTGFESLSSDICFACGGKGHTTSDCRLRRPGVIFARNYSTVESFDKEYASFMDELNSDDVANATREGGRFSSAPANSILNLMATEGSSQKKFPGKSIFGGKLTPLTSGYKTSKNIDKDKIHRESDVSSIPTSWQIERYASQCSKQYDDFIDNLEKQNIQEKANRIHLNSAKLNPQLLETANLPQLIGTPLMSLKKS